MAKVKITKEAELKKMADEILEFNIKAESNKEENPYRIVNLNLLINWNQIAKEAEKKYCSITNQKKLNNNIIKDSYVLYSYFMAKQQYNRNKEEEKKIGLPAYEGSCYEDVKNIQKATCIHHTKFQLAVKLLVCMNLLIVKQNNKFSKNNYSKYYYYPMYVPNKELCEKYGSDFIEKTEEEKANCSPKTKKKEADNMTIKEVVKKHSKSKGKGSIKVTYIDEYRKAN